MAVDEGRPDAARALAEVEGLLAQMGVVPESPLVAEVREIRALLDAPRGGPLPQRARDGWSIPPVLRPRRNQVR